MKRILAISVSAGALALGQSAGYGLPGGDIKGLGAGYGVLGGDIRALEFQLDRLGAGNDRLFGDLEQLRSLNMELKLFAQADTDKARTLSRGISGGISYGIGRGDEDRYQRGKRALDQRAYDEAVRSFDQVIDGKGARVDGALYWKAYALNKVGKRPEALAAVSELEKSYPQSSWLNDARALKLEIQQASGQPAGAALEGGDEELKLLALNSLVHSDPERALPILEKLLKDPKASPKMKDKALFVLAQSDEKGREMLAQMAKGASNPDLQITAIRYLGVFKNKGNGQLLNDIYNSSKDVAVRRQVLQALMIAGDRERMFSAAKSEQNPELRREAIQSLGAMHAQSELAQLYGSETSTEGKEQIISSLAVGQNADKLIEIGKSDKDPNMRKLAAQRLGIIRNEKATEGLVSIYTSTSDKGVKQEAINGLFIQHNGKALVDVARKETDPQLKKEIVSRLGVMRGSKEASDYLMELLSK